MRFERITATDVRSGDRILEPTDIRTVEEVRHVNQVEGTGGHIIWREEDDVFSGGTWLPDDELFRAAPNEQEGER